MSPCFKKGFIKEAFVGAAVRAGFRGAKNIGHRISQTKGGQRVVNSTPARMAKSLGGSSIGQTIARNPGTTVMTAGFGAMEAQNVARKTSQHTKIPTGFRGNQSANPRMRN